MAGGRDRELGQEALMAEEVAQSVISGSQRLFRDNDNMTTGWSVCRYLGLIRADAPRPARKVWKAPSFLTLVAAAAVSLLRLVIFVPLA